MGFTGRQGLLPFLLFLAFLPLPTTVNCHRPPTASPLPPPPVPDSIEGICNLTTDPSVCISAVTPHLPIPTTTTSVLLVLLKAAKDETATDVATFSDLAKNPKASPEMVAALENCEHHYRRSLDDYSTAMAAVEGKDLLTVSTRLASLSVRYAKCSLGNGPGLPPTGPWIEFNERLMKFVRDCSDLCARVKSRDLGLNRSLLIRRGKQAN